MALWVKFHEDLCKGEKRDLSRATRFIYMELSLEARKRMEIDGIDAILPLSSRGTVVWAVSDLIGGANGEIRHAMEALTAGPEPMIVVEETGASSELAPTSTNKTLKKHRQLRLCAWGKWNQVDPSSHRVKKHREQKHEVTENVTRYMTVTPSPCNAPVTVLEESRVEENKEKEEPGAIAPAVAQVSIDVGAAPKPSKPRPETNLGLGWRRWKELYAASSRRYGAYTRTTGDGPAMTRIVALAADQTALAWQQSPSEIPARIDELLCHWFKAFLRDNGSKNFNLQDQRHALRFMERGIPAYGVPWKSDAMGVVIQKPIQEPKQETLIETDLAGVAKRGLEAVAAAKRGEIVKRLA